MTAQTLKRSVHGERGVVCPYGYIGEEQAGDEAGARHKKRDNMHEGDAATGGGTLGAR